MCEKMMQKNVFYMMEIDSKTFYSATESRNTREKVLCHTVRFFDNKRDGIKESRNRTASSSSTPHTDMWCGEII